MFTVGSQVASREAAHRRGRPRGMLFFCGVGPPTLCSKTWLRGCCVAYLIPDAKTMTNQDVANGKHGINTEFCRIS